MHPLLPVLLLVLGITATAPGETIDLPWPHWRGPTSNGVAPASAQPPIQWSETEHLQWKVPLPGEGSATPIVTQDAVLIAAAVPTDRAAETPVAQRDDAKTQPPGHYYQFLVMAFRRDNGQELWRRVVCEAVPDEGKHRTNTYASASPVTDGERIYVSFGSRGTFALSMQGDLLWHYDTGPIRTRFGWGEATSPAVADGHVILKCDQEEGSYLVALDAATGRPVWKASRDEPTSWSSPYLVSHAGQVQVIANATHQVRSYDLRTGRVLWQCGGQTLNTIPMPVHVGDTVCCMSGYKGAFACAVRLDAQGEVTAAPHLAWKYTADTPYVPSPVAYRDHLYFTKGNTGLLTSLAWSTGERTCEPLRLPGIDMLYASPVAAAGRLYFLGRQGTMVVLEASANPQVIATNQLDEPIDASPALAGQQLFLRSNRFLYALAE